MEKFGVLYDRWRDDKGKLSDFPTGDRQLDDEFQPLERCDAKLSNWLLLCISEFI